MLHLIDIMPHSTNIFNTYYYIKSSLRVHCHCSSIQRTLELIWLTLRKARISRFLVSLFPTDRKDFPYRPVTHAGADRRPCTVAPQEQKWKLRLMLSPVAEPTGLCVGPMNFISSTAVGKQFTFDCSLVDRRGR